MELIAYFWEQEDASSVAAQLNGTVRRGRFHGEDDDEDHPWVVVLPAAVDRPELDALLAKYDGWLETADDEPVVAPPPLPSEPQRFKTR
jgi:hypothetical protein